VCARFTSSAVSSIELLIIGRVRETGLALLPLVLGAVWTIGLMALCSIAAV
jgi:hypothetical protein